MSKTCQWCRKEDVAGRVCRICSKCILERDKRDKLLDEGKIPYVPPDQRPGHRFFERRIKAQSRSRPMSTATKAKMQATRAAKTATKGARARPTEV